MGVATLVIVVILPISMWLLLGHQAYEKQLKVKEDAVLGKVPTASQKPSEKAIECSTMMRSWRRREVLKDYRFYLILPAVSATSLVSTALFFHHLNLADEKGWWHTFITGNYLLYSIVAALMAVVAGQLVDRFSALALMPYT